MNNIEAIVAVGQDIELDGRRYRLRRLTVRDVLRFAGILTQGLDNVRDASEFAAAVLSKVTSPELASFYADVLGVTTEEFLSLSPEAFAQFMSVLRTHPDIESFFEAVRMALSGPVSMLQPASTSSSTDMAGPTKKS